jgi:hypothetical protein
VGKVTLQVQQRFTSYIAQFITVEIELNHFADVLRIVDELLDGVIVRIQMNRNSVVLVISIY